MLRDRLKYALPFLVSLIWFALFLSQNLSVAHDSVAYLVAAVTGHNMWHPNHLLGVPLMALFIDVGATLKLPLSPIALATVPNILGGALLVQVVFLYLHRRLSLGFRDSLLGSCLPAVSFGTWYYSVAIEAYVIPVFLMFLCLYLLAGDNRTAKTFYVVAVLHSLAALFHQYSILLGPLVVYALIITPAIESRKKLPLFLQYVVITAVIVGGTNILVSNVVADVGNASEFLAWLAGNASSEAAAQFVGGFSLKTIMFAFVGFSRALIGGHFAFAVPELQETLSTVFAAQSLNDERFLVSPLSPTMARILLAAAVLWGIGLVVAVARSLQYLGELRHNSATVMVLWVLVPPLLLFTFYFGHNVEFWLVQSVCLWILLSWALSRMQATRTTIALLLGLALINFIGSMQFVGTADRDYHQWRIQPVAADIQPGDMVVIGNWWPTAGFVEYFTGVKPTILDRNFSEQINVIETTDLVQQKLATHNRVFVYDDVYHIDKSAVYHYGPNYVEYVEKFRLAIPSGQPLSTETGRGHRLIVSAEN